MTSSIKDILLNALPDDIANAILESYSEMKENFYLRRFRPSELEAGRFVECAVRAIQFLSTGNYTSLSKNLGRLDIIVQGLANVPADQAHESLRLHIPNILLSVYRIRNRRNVGHVGGDVNPNAADSYLVLNSCNWVLSELVRIIYDCSLDEAQRIVDDIVELNIPIIEEIEGDAVILNPDLSNPKKILLLAYYKRAEGVNIDFISKSLSNETNNAIKTALRRLEEKVRIYLTANGFYKITKVGIRYVESNIDLQY